MESLEDFLLLSLTAAQILLSQYNGTQGASLAQARSLERQTAYYAFLSSIL
jgi:hypothetical protein